MTRNADIIIIGLGVYGSAVARELAARGWRVVGVEQSPAHLLWGASRGPIRIVRESDPDRPWMAPLARESIELWRTLEKTADRPLFRATRGIVAWPDEEIAAPEKQTLDWLRALEPAAVDDPLLAGLDLARGWKTAVDGASGLLDSRASVMALRTDAADRGARLLFDRQVELSGLQPAASGVTIRAGEEILFADKLLICAGAWAAGLPAWAGFPGLHVEPAAVNVATIQDDTPAPLDANDFLVLYGSDHRFCVLPSADGRTLQFGHFALPVTAAESASGDLKHVIRRRDLAALRRCFPALGRLRRHSTFEGRYAVPPSGSFVLRWGSPSVATLVACSGVGFKFAPAIARRAALTLEGGEVPDSELRVESRP